MIHIRHDLLQYEKLHKQNNQLESTSNLNKSLFILRIDDAFLCYLIIDTLRKRFELFVWFTVYLLLGSWWQVDGQTVESKPDLIETITQ